MAAAERTEQIAERILNKINEELSAGLLDEVECTRVVADVCAALLEDRGILVKVRLDRGFGAFLEITSEG